MRHRISAGKHLHEVAAPERLQHTPLERTERGDTLGYRQRFRTRRFSWSRLRHPIRNPPGPECCSDDATPDDQSGDLVGLFADLDLNLEPATDRLNGLPEGVDLGSFDVTVLDARDPVLSHVQQCSEFDLGEVVRFAELAELAEAIGSATLARDSR